MRPAGDDTNLTLEELLQIIMVMIVHLAASLELRQGSLVNVTNMIIILTTIILIITIRDAPKYGFCSFLALLKNL